MAVIAAASARTYRVLEAIVAIQRMDSTVQEIAAVCDIKAGAVHRYVAALHSYGLIEPCGTRTSSRGTKPIVWKWRKCPA